MKRLVALLLFILAFPFMWALPQELAITIGDERLPIKILAFCIVLLISLIMFFLPDQESSSTARPSMWSRWFGGKNNSEQPTPTKPKWHDKRTCQECELIPHEEMPFWKKVMIFGVLPLLVTFLFMKKQLIPDEYALLGVISQVVAVIVIGICVYIMVSIFRAILARMKLFYIIVPENHAVPVERFGNFHCMYINPSHDMRGHFEAYARYHNRITPSNPHGHEFVRICSGITPLAGPIRYKGQTVIPALAIRALPWKYRAASPKFLHSRDARLTNRERMQYLPLDVMILDYPGQFTNNRGEVEKDDNGVPLGVIPPAHDKSMMQLTLSATAEVQILDPIKAWYNSRYILSAFEQSLFETWGLAAEQLTFAKTNNSKNPTDWKFSTAIKRELLKLLVRYFGNGEWSDAINAVAYTQPRYGVSGGRYILSMPYAPDSRAYVLFDRYGLAASFRVEDLDPASRSIAEQIQASRAADAKAIVTIKEARAQAAATRERDSADAEGIEKKAAAYSKPGGQQVAAVDVAGQLPADTTLITDQTKGGVLGGLVSAGNAFERGRNRSRRRNGNNDQGQPRPQGGS